MTEAIDKLREKLREALEKEREKTPEQLQRDLEDTYKGITPEDAVRIRDSIVAVLDIKTQQEKDQLTADYKRLHAELRKKYGKSGK